MESNASVNNVTTMNAAEEEHKEMNIGWQAILKLTACVVIIAGTILGNLLVCTAVAIVRRLRTPSNLLIVSLAVSDLLVASLVMTFAAAYEVKQFYVHSIE